MALVQFIDDSAPYLSADNLNNNFNELNTKITQLITTDNFTSNSITINANSTYSYTFNVAKTGYTALGILWVDAASNDLALSKYSQFGNSAYIRFRNITSSAITTTFTIKVLYIKS